MLKYKLVARNADKTIYMYYPEGDMKNPGIIAFLNDGGRETIQRAKDDDFGWYLGHAFSGIDRNEDSGMIAWY